VGVFLGFGLFVLRDEALEPHAPKNMVLGLELQFLPGNIEHLADHRFIGLLECAEVVRLTLREEP
jgi:hypothetical protein